MQYCCAQVCAHCGRPSILKLAETTTSVLQVVVFSWTGCPFCKKAKALLTDLGADFTAVELDLMGKEGSALRAELGKARHSTGPLFFHDSHGHTMLVSFLYSPDPAHVGSMCKNGCFLSCVLFETRQRPYLQKCTLTHMLYKLHAWHASSACSTGVAQEVAW